MRDKGEEWMGVEEFTCAGKLSIRYVAVAQVACTCWISVRLSLVNGTVYVQNHILQLGFNLSEGSSEGSEASNTIRA